MVVTIHALLVRRQAIATAIATLAVSTVAYVLAFALRFDVSIPPQFVRVLIATLPLLLVCKLVAFWSCRLYAGSWLHVSINDVEDIVRGNVLAGALFLAAMVFVYGLDGFPRAIFPLDLMLSTAALAGVRIAIRVGRERRERSGVRRIESLAVIIGAGNAGIRLLQELETRRRGRIAVVGFVDDDPAKQGRRICGVPVLGGVDDLVEIAPAHDVEEALIAIPSASGAALRRIVQTCTEAKLRHRVLPTLAELVEGRVIYTQMREVKVDDLLARQPVRLDLERVRSLVGGRRVLVTGAAGSIGSELCRQLAARDPERLVLYDRHENGVFLLEMELRARFPQVRLEPVLGDVLLPDQLDAIFGVHRPDIIFHAAAYKHVPIAERNVIEAVRNNVLGTRNVARAAIAHGAREFVLVSTDKAVRPTSVMGVTKRVAELLVQEPQGSGCRFVAVRFGNVLGSSGSVVPLFREQIARGGPVTVTHADVTRYFMTIPEAAQLILEAATIGNGGEIFVLDMGEPVRIADLARQMIRLSGLEPDEDIEVVFTGLRPGEKMHEELVAEGEEIGATRHDRIRVLRANPPTSFSDVWLPRLEAAVRTGDVRAAVRLLRVLVPAYTPNAELPRSPEPDAVGLARDGTAG